MCKHVYCITVWHYDRIQYETNVWHAEKLKSGWLSLLSVSRQTFSNRYCYSFSLILTKLGTCSMCQYAQNCGTLFRNFAFTIFAEFFNFIQITTPTVFLRFSWDLAHVIYVPIHKKTVEQIFESLILIFWHLKKFKSADWQAIDP